MRRAILNVIEHAKLSLPPKRPLFKIKSYLPELRSSNPQNPVKIIPSIFPIIHHERHLRSDRFFAKVHIRNAHLPSLKCSAHVRHIFHSHN